VSASPQVSGGDNGCEDQASHYSSVGPPFAFWDQCYDSGNIFAENTGEKLTTCLKEADLTEQKNAHAIGCQENRHFFFFLPAYYR
jgi:hypothetical protein